MSYARHTVAGLIIGLALGASLMIPVIGGAQELDRELRCCFRLDDLRQGFMVVLTGVGRPVAHLSVATPGNRRVGYDPASMLFYPPTKNEIYASGYAGAEPIYVSEWPKQRERVLLLRALQPGTYRVQVSGLKDGRYFLMFQPAGYGDTSGSLSFGGGKPFGVAIKRSERHVYAFAVPFADVHDGSLPRNSPSRFRVTREQ